nr:putative ribonuclease H-like domain-containing protein [Tanacetum cinerariifolium]
NYMPFKSNFGIDESKFAYGLKQSTTSEYDAKTSDLDSYDSSFSEETLETMPKPVESQPNVVNEPKVWSDDPIIEEYESDSDDEYVFSHLIRDCDFHEKRMAKHVELNKQIDKKISQATSTRNVNTARPKVNEIKPRHNVSKFHSPIRRPFNKTTAPKAKFGQQKVNTVGDKSVSVVGGKWETAVKASAGNKAYIVDYQDFNGGTVAFGGSKGQITVNGKIKSRKLVFKDVYFVKELHHFNLFSVSQICDKKNKVLFTDTECLILFPDFKLPDENQVLLRVPRQHNMYSFNLENIVPSRGLACLIAKATVDESTKCTEG